MIKRALQIVVKSALICAICALFFPIPLVGETFSTLAGAVDMMSSKYRVHFGLEYASNDQDKRPFNLDLSPSRVEQVLDKLVIEKPEYLWAWDDGVYILYPKTNASSLLQLKIRAFAIHDASEAEALEGINQLPEVADWFSKENAKRREIEVRGPRECSANARVSVKLNAVTFRTVLNSLIKAFRCSNWTIVRYGGNRQFVAIYFR
jgi:hypothetical protein